MFALNRILIKKLIYCHKTDPKMRLTLKLIEAIISFSEAIDSQRTRAINSMLISH